MLRHGTGIILRVIEARDWGERGNSLKIHLKYRNSEEARK